MGLLESNPGPFPAHSCWGRGLVLSLGSVFLAFASQASDIPTFTAQGIVLTEVFQYTTSLAPTSRFEEAAVFPYSNAWWQMELKFSSGGESYAVGL
jgi:hypothetical protein